MSTSIGDIDYYSAKPGPGEGNYFYGGCSWLMVNYGHSWYKLSFRNEKNIFLENSSVSTHVQCTVSNTSSKSYLYHQVTPLAIVGLLPVSAVSAVSEVVINVIVLPWCSLAFRQPKGWLFCHLLQWQVLVRICVQERGSLHSRHVPQIPLKEEDQ